MLIKSKRNKIILLLFFFALLLRTLYILTLDNEHVGEWDDVGWEIAKNLAEGKGYKMAYVLDNTYSFRPPSFPLFLTGIFLVFGQDLLIARIFLVILSSLNCIIIYILGKKIFNPTVGLIAILISIIYPAFIYWSGYLGPETLATLLLSLSLLFVLMTVEKDNIFYAVLCGISLGFLSLCKSMVLGSIFLFFIWIIFSSQNKRRGLKKAFLMVLIAIVTISPWVIRNYKIHHAFLLSSTDGGVTFYSANNPEVLTKGRRDFTVPADTVLEARRLTEIQADRFFYKKGLDFIKSHPKIYLSLIFERAIRFWRFYPHITGAQDSYKAIHVVIMLLTDAPIILLAFWGLTLLFKKDKTKAILLALIFGYFTLVSMFIRSCIRYRAPITPYLIILASYVIYTWYGKVRSCR